MFQVTSRIPSDEVLRQQFLRSYNMTGMRETMPLLSDDRQDYVQQWYRDLEDEMKVKWQRPPRQLER